MAVPVQVMGGSSEMLAYGQFGQTERSILEEAARASQVLLHTTDSSSEASAWLDTHEASAILLGTGHQPENLAMGTRAQSRHRQLPILALTREPGDLDFAAAYSWGADDVVAPDKAWPLTQRLRALTRSLRSEQSTARGTALVAEVDQFRRVAIARALFNAGYDVRFALTPEDAQAFVREAQVTLVVLCTELCEDPVQFIHAALHAGSQAKFIVSAEPRRHNGLSQGLARESQARLTDASAPPENVVFLANELEAGALPNKRASPRIPDRSWPLRMAGRCRDGTGDAPPQRCCWAW